LGSGREDAASSSELLPGAFSFADVYALARCQRLCKRARDLVSVPHVWEPRLRAVCAAWSLPCPTARAGGALVGEELDKGASWRDLFFELRRPRCDGIYVGQCRYVSRIPPGATMQANIFTKGYQWVEYQRYLRLLPPDPADGGILRALVLRDVCPFKAAVAALASMDPRAHVNCLAPEKSLEHRTHVSTQEKIETHVAAGTYTWVGDQVEVRFENCGDNYHLVFELGDGHPEDMRFSGHLEWSSYSMLNKRGEDVPFGLGRSRYGGGDPEDCEKDHFPPLCLRQCRQLEYLL